MTLKQQILSDLKDAMRAKEVVKRDTLRMLDAAIKNVEIEKQKREIGLSEEETMEVVMRLAKQRRDSIEQFVAGGRVDLAAKEEEELKIIEKYLPTQLGEEEVRLVVLEIIKEVNPQSASDLGKIMGQAMNRLKGQTDGNVVRVIAMDELEKLGK